MDRSLFAGFPTLAELFALKKKNGDAAAAPAGGFRAAPRAVPPPSAFENFIDAYLALDPTVALDLCLAINGFPNIRSFFIVAKAQLQERKIKVSDMPRELSSPSTLTRKGALAFFAEYAEFREEYAKFLKAKLLSVAYNPEGLLKAWNAWLAKNSGIKRYLTTNVFFGKPPKARSRGAKNRSKSPPAGFRIRADTPRPEEIKEHTEDDEDASERDSDSSIEIVDEPEPESKNEPSQGEPIKLSHNEDAIVRGAGASKSLARPSEFPVGAKWFESVVAKSGSKFGRCHSGTKSGTRCSFAVNDSLAHKGVCKKHDF
jgi:hypothetical protein